MRLIEFEYRVSPADVSDDAEPVWRTAAERPREGVGSFTIEGLDLGVTYDLRARYVDEQTGDELSDWTLWPGNVVEKDAIAPPPVQSVRLTKGDCVTWELDREILDLRGFLVRHAPGWHGGSTEEGWGLAERAHEEIVGAPPFVLCRVPKGPRTIIVRPIDWDDNLGPPVKIITNRGPIDDVAEYVVRTVDEAGANFGNGTVAGATAPSAILTADALPEADDDQPMFPSEIEPWMSLDADAPMFPLDDDAPMFGETWGDEAEWFSRNDSDAMFGNLYSWVEYVWSFTLHADEGGPGAVLSIDCECDGVAWRLMYREHDPLAWFDANPYEPMFPVDDNDPMFPAPDSRPWRPWPGRLLDPSVGRYDFRLIIPGGHEQFRCTRLAVTYSRVGRVEHVAPFSTPAIGGTRAPIAERWRKIVHVDAIPVGVETAVDVPVGNKSPAKGPDVRTLDGDSITPAWLDVTIRGY